MNTTTPSREELRAFLVASRIAGDVATPRDNNLRSYRLMSDRDPRYLFGLQPQGTWTSREVLALMAQRCGVSPDPEYADGPDTIDPDLTIDRLDGMADRLRTAAERGERVLLATGHPTGLLAIHLEVAAALAAAGCTVVTPAAGWACEFPTGWGRQVREIRYVGGVAMLSDGGDLNHTHSPLPMQAILAALLAADSASGLPGLVVGDHGWAGAAGQAGVDAVGFADSNDPALFVGEAEGRIGVVVPLDDNVGPHLYAPLTSYLLHRARLLFPTRHRSH